MFGDEGPESSPIATSTMRWAASARDDEFPATACGGLIGGQYSTPVRSGGAASIRSMGSALAGIET